MSKRLRSNKDPDLSTKYESIVNVLKHARIGISRISEKGSRAPHQHRSEMTDEIIISVSNDPPQHVLFQSLMAVLKKSFPDERIYYSHDTTSIHLDFVNGEKFDITFFPESEFDKAYNDFLVPHEKKMKK